MPKFRKKPVVIEAVQWTGGPSWPAISALNDGIICHSHYQTLSFRTLEGTMTASLGDWIIKGVKGEVYPCKPDIFSQSYDAVEPSSDAVTQQPPPAPSDRIPAWELTMRDAFQRFTDQLLRASLRAKEDQTTIEEWRSRTFGVTKDAGRLAARANVEMAELIEALSQGDEKAAAFEVADVVIVLYGVAECLGIDLHDTIDDKMKINRERVWKVAGDGTGKHAREPDAPPVHVIHYVRTPPLGLALVATCSCGFTSSDTHLMNNSDHAIAVHISDAIARGETVR